MSDGAKVQDRPSVARVAIEPCARQPAAERRASGAGRRLGRACHRIVLAVLALLLFAAAAAAALFWRMSQAPLDVTWLVRRAEARLNLPGSPSRFAIGYATVQWRAFEQGAGEALEVQAWDMRVGPDEDPALLVSQARVQLSPGALLIGKVVPRSVMLDGLRLHLVRERDGKVGLDLLGGSASELDSAAPADSVADMLALLRRPAGTDASLTGAGVQQLRSVRVHDAAVEVRDRRLGAVLRLDGAAADLVRQPGGGMTGTADARLAAGEVASTLHLRANLGEAGAGTRIEATLTPVSPAALTQAVPALAQLALLDAPVEASATLDLLPNLAPQAVSVRAGAGAGRVRTPAAAVPFESFSLEAGAKWGASQDWGRPDQADVTRFQTVIASPSGGWPSTVRASVHAVRAGPGIRADVTASVDHAAVADMPALWPVAWSGHTRPWLTENLTAGTVRDGRFAGTVQAAADGSGAKLTSGSGTLLGDDMTINWLRPVPPIEHAQAVLTLVSPDVLEIALPSGRQGAAQLSNGLVRIKGLSVKDQDLALSADVSATVPDLLTLLRHPRLNLLSRHPIAVQRPAGAVLGKLSVALPLEHHLQFEQVAIHAEGKLTDLRLGGIVAGRDLDHGSLTFDVTTKALQASGQAEIASVPAAVALDMDFTPGPGSQAMQRATAAGRATARQLGAAGLDFGGIVGAGQAGFRAIYTERRDATAEVAVQSDLRDAALSLAGWSKAPGQPATASARLVLRGGHLQGISDLQAQGPDMEVRGRAEMIGDRPAHLVLDPIHLGPTRARGDIRLPSGPNEPIRATLDGSVLDLGPALARKPASRPAAPEPRGTPWVADVRFDKVLLSGGRGIGGVTAHAENDGRRVSAVHAESSGAERLRLDIAPRGNGRQVSLRSADGGGLAQALDLTDTVQGGVLTVEAQYDDTRPDPPLSGTASLSDFHIRNAPGIGKLLQALTVYGIGEAMSGPGLAFSQMTAPFRWEGGVLTLQEAQAFSSSLGLTARGRIDTGAKTVDLHGTIVPVYALNAALGRLPVIGRLFSAERGGGLLALGFSYRGDTANPAVLVNPLSALTPGFLRGLFRMFD